MANVGARHAVPLQLLDPRQVLALNSRLSTIPGQNTAVSYPSHRKVEREFRPAAELIPV